MRQQTFKAALKAILREIEEGRERERNQVTDAGRRYAITGMIGAIKSIAENALEIK